MLPPTSSSVNASLQRVFVLAWALVLAGVCVGLIVGVATGILLLGLAVVFALPIVLMLQFLVMGLVNGGIRGLGLRRGDLLRAWPLELAASVRVFGWQQPFRSGSLPDVLPQHPHGRRGVLLVHGFACTRGLWLPWMRRLRQRGDPHLAITLEPPWGPIEAYCDAIEAAVARLERSTGLAPVVVAHSMGGLAVRAWWVQQPPQRLHRLITIGTPHQGTLLAALGPLPNVRQMRRASPWLAALAQQEQAAHRQRVVCFWSPCDNIVFPAPTATLDGADNRLLHGAGHMRMIWSGEPWDELQRCLAPAPQVH